MTDEDDFDTRVRFIMFPADEGSPQSDIDASIPVINDTVDEAESQFFYAVFEILNATNLELIDTGGINVTLCNIRDDDGK